MNYPYHAWILCGLSRVETLNIDTLLDDMNSREFAKVSRVLWEHMLFDQLAIWSDLPNTASRDYRPLDSEKIRFFRNRSGTKDVGPLKSSPQSLYIWLTRTRFSRTFLFSYLALAS